MPQMAPMNWIFLYLMFTLIFMIFNFLNYYMYLLTKKNKYIKNLKFNILTWKW